MIEYRTFLNTDPPLIVDIWRRQPPSRSVVEGVTRATLDRYVFAKPYFDRNGLFMALKDGEPVGFAHAGFAPNLDQSDLDLTVGVLCQLKVIPGEASQQVALELVKLCVDYLKSKGATECHGGSRFPHAPFYLGLYGGSRLPGVLQEDEVMVGALAESGFVKSDEFIVLSRNLTGFRIPVDRNLINARRRYQISPLVDPRERTWWECCCLGMADRDSFTVTDRRDRSTAGQVVFWDMLPLANEWGVQARGIYDLRISPEHRGGALEAYLLGESLKQLKEQGIGLIEAQTSIRNEQAIEVFTQLGFEETGRGVHLSAAL